MKLLKEVIEDQNMVLRKRKNNKLFIFPEIVSMVQRKGNKKTVEHRLLRSMRGLRKTGPVLLKSKTISSFLNLAINNAKPYIGLRSKKIGSVTYHIPVSLRPSKEISQGIYWVVSESCGYKMGPFEKCLESELSNVLEGQGKSLKKKEALYNLVVKNRAYIKFLFRYK